MNHRHLTAATAFVALVSGAMLPAFADAADPRPANPVKSPRPALAASAASQPLPQKLAAAAEPGELRPERAVVPQISVPLGRTPPPPLEPRSSKLNRDGIDDRAARRAAQ